MLYRIEVDVIDMGSIVAIASNRVLPVSALPNPTLSPVDHNRGALLGRGQGFRERRLDIPPAAGKIRVTLGKGPQAVHVVGQYHPGVDVEWESPSHLTYRVAQRVDPRDEKVGTAVE